MEPENEYLKQRILYLERQISGAREHMKKGWNGSAASLLDACKPFDYYTNSNP